MHAFVVVVSIRASFDITILSPADIHVSSHINQQSVSFMEFYGRVEGV